MQTRVCQEPELAALDKHLDVFYRKAMDTFPDDEIAGLQADQRSWIAGRDDCWKTADFSGCVTTEYERRITELEIAVADMIVPAAAVFLCESGATVSAYFYNETRFDSLVINRGPDQALLYRVRSASGAKYEGQNVAFWQKGTSAQMEWNGEKNACRLQ